MLLAMHNIGNVMLLVNAFVATWMVIFSCINEKWHTSLGYISLGLQVGLAMLFGLLASHETITGVFYTHNTQLMNSAIWYESAKLGIFAFLGVCMLIRITVGFIRPGRGFNEGI